MRVRTKLITITLFVAVVPLAISAFQSLSVHKRALTSALVRLHANTSQYGATTVDNYLENLRSSLSTVVRNTIDWNQLSKQETAGALWLIFGQFESSQIVQLHSETQSSAAYLSEPNAVAPLRKVLNRQAVAAFEKKLPQATVVGAIGSIIDIEPGLRLLPISILDKSQTRSLSLGLSVQPLCARLARLRPHLGHVELFNAQRRRICSTRHKALNSPVSAELQQILKQNSAQYERVGNGNKAVQGSVSRTRGGWSITVEQPNSVFTTHTRVLQRQSILWVIIGAATALVSGLILSRSIHRPLEGLAQAAVEIGGGNLEFRLSESSTDEFGQLSRAFNKMSKEIAKRDWEIHFWNEQLQQRVEERSQQLENANQALIRSRKLAGLSTLTAGIAHEMNNPLTGILGLTQVLVARMKKSADNQSSVTLLQSVVQESQRMQRLLQKMMTLNEPTDDRTFQAVSLEPLLNGVHLAENEQMVMRKAKFSLKVSPDTPNVLGNPKLLSQLFQALIENALKALPEAGGGISVKISPKGTEWVRVVIEDNGHGIKPELLGRVREPFFTTKTGGRGEGLGLARAHQLVELHSGTLEIRSEWQVRTEVEVVLPVASTGAHLV